MIQTIIGLNGRLHSGKDTAFESIRAHYAETGLVAKRVAFADPLKMSAAWALGYQPSTVEAAVEVCNDLKEHGLIAIGDDRTAHFEDDGEVWINKADCGLTGREYLQFYGTEAHRDVFGQDFWVDATLPDTLAKLDEKYDDVDVLVVTDVRFPNEAQRILDHGGEVWWIAADERLGALPEDVHPSEQPLEASLVSLVVTNNGTLDDYQECLQTALEGL